MIERKPIQFGKWTPVLRDNAISYSYVNPSDGRTVNGWGWRWMHAKHRIAASAISTGVLEFKVWGGLGSRRWVRTVTCSQEEAHAFFEEAISGGSFILKREYRRALSRAEGRG